MKIQRWPVCEVKMKVRHVLGQGSVHLDIMSLSNNLLSQVMKS